MDTSIAYISSVSPINRNQIIVQFSQSPIESRKFDTGRYLIKIADTDSTLPISIAYSGEGESVILETHPQRKGVPYRVIPHGLITAWGLSFDTTGALFTGVDTPDTVGPRLLSTFPPNGSRSIYQDSSIVFTFSERLSPLQFSDAVVVVADSLDTLNLDVAWPAPNIARLRFAERLTRERNIDVAIMPSKIFDASNNLMTDSALSFSFRLPPSDTTGSVIAEIHLGHAAKIVGLLSQLLPGDNNYKSRFDPSGALHIGDILPGVYRFEFFEDVDSNDEWSPGLIMRDSISQTALPFRQNHWMPKIGFAEPFSFLPDTIKVRSRWETQIGAVALPEFNQ
jgi:hypothetical protein